MKKRVRKTVAQPGRIKVDRSARYHEVYEELVGKGLERLEADLRAHVAAAHASCNCETCKGVPDDATSLEAFVPGDHKWHAEWYIEQYVRCSNCDMVPEIVRYRELWADRRGSLGGVSAGAPVEPERFQVWVRFR